MKIIFACVLLLIVPLFLKAQMSEQTQGVFDTTYNNYLYDSRLAYFKDLPVSEGEIVFVGNSITHWGDWAELLNNAKVRNRGIAGDISFGVLARMDEVISRKPEKIFLMIGVNDIGRKIPLSMTLRNYERILSLIKQKTPASKVFVQSVLPINNDLINRKYFTGTNKEIARLNIELEKLAARLSVPYLNLNRLFLGADGQMQAKYTYDGIHLSAAGYLLWSRFLKDNKYCCD